MKETKRHTPPATTHWMAPADRCGSPNPLVYLSCSGHCIHTTPRRVLLWQAKHSLLYFENAEVALYVLTRPRPQAHRHFLFSPVYRTSKDGVNFLQRMLLHSSDGMPATEKSRSTDTLNNLQKETDRQTDGQIDRWTDRQTDNLKGRLDSSSCWGLISKNSAETTTQRFQLAARESSSGE